MDCKTNSFENYICGSSRKLFLEIVQGIKTYIEVNGVTFDQGYYLADGIFLEWSSFVKLFSVAHSNKNAVFKQNTKVLEKTLKEHLVSSKDVGILLPNRPVHRLSISYGESCTRSSYCITRF